jgi:hypothetical protein
MDPDPNRLTIFSLSLCRGDASDYCVRLRGLPWSATKQDIADFLERCRVVGGTDGVIIIKDERWVRG